MAHSKRFPYSPFRFRFRCLACGHVSCHITRKGANEHKREHAAECPCNGSQFTVEAIT